MSAKEAAALLGLDDDFSLIAGAAMSLRRVLPVVQAHIGQIAIERQDTMNAVDDYETIESVIGWLDNIAADLEREG